MTDEQIMSLIKAGELTYVSQLYTSFGKKLYNYFLKSTLQHADSDDLLQELFIRVIKYRKSYKDGQKVQHWIFQIARNMLKDHFSKMKVHREAYDLVDRLPEVYTEEDESLEKEKRLYQAMTHLSEEKRELLALSKFQGMKYEQIAEIKGITVANVKVQVHRAIKELKEHFFKITKHEAGI